jgi:hypothetical protein
MTQAPRTVDPDRIPETVCDGPFNVLYSSGRATLTFTHTRPQTGPLLEQGEIMNENVVRARIVFSMENLVSLRDVLNSMLPSNASTDHAAASSGGTKLH